MTKHKAPLPHLRLVFIVGDIYERHDHGCQTFSSGLGLFGFRNVSCLDETPQQWNSGHRGRRQASMCRCRHLLIWLDPEPSALLVALVSGPSSRALQSGCLGSCGFSLRIILSFLFHLRSWLTSHASRTSRGPCRQKGQHAPTAEAQSCCAPTSRFDFLSLWSRSRLCALLSGSRSG